MNQRRYPIPAGQHRVEEEIMRSRFITTAVPAGTIEEARAFVDRMREEFPDATHNCWAFLVGSPGSSTRVGMSDDGEPAGTAGRPMLNILSHCPVGDIAVVVTRYYGGTKLGKGGLVRAYSGGVQLVLESLPTVEKVYRKKLTVVAEYSDVKTLKRLMTSHEAEIHDERFEVDVTYDLAVPDDQATDFRKPSYQPPTPERWWRLKRIN